MATSQASQSADPTGAAYLRQADWKVTNVDIEPRAFDLYGDEMTENGVKFAQSLARNYGFHQNAVKYPAGDGISATRKWMLTATKQMTPGAARDWTRTVKSYFAGGKEYGLKNRHYGDIQSYTSYGLYENGMHPEATVPLMERPTIKRLDVDVAADGRMWVHMDTSVIFNFVQEGKAAQARGIRKQEFWFERVGNAWKVDGWNGQMETKILDED